MIKRLLSWFLFLVATWALLAPNLERLLLVWSGATLFWIILHRRTFPLLLIGAWTGALLVAFTLPAVLPNHWPPLLRLGLVALIWSVVLGVALRLGAARQKEARLP